MSWKNLLKGIIGEANVRTVRTDQIVVKPTHKLSKGKQFRDPLQHQVRQKDIIQDVTRFPAASYLSGADSN